MEDKVLVIVDPQNDFCSEGGSLVNKECIEAVDRIVKWLPEHINEYEHIIVTMDTHDDNYLETREGKHLPIEHCIKDTHGQRIQCKLFDLLDSYCYLYLYTGGGVYCSENKKIVCLPKDRFSVDWDLLKSRINNHLFDYNFDICGVCTDICVISNALSLQKYTDNEITCLSNLCAGTTPENHEAALKVMKSCQINIK